jgi:hypothetical protein
MFYFDANDFSRQTRFDGCKYLVEWPDFSQFERSLGGAVILAAPRAAVPSKQKTMSAVISGTESG